MARLSPEEGLGTLEDRAGKAEQETWKRFHPAYEVSDLGRVRRTLEGPGARAGRILTPNKNRGGYSKIKHGRTWKQVA